MRSQAKIAVLVLAMVLLSCETVAPDRAVLNSLETIKASAQSSMSVIGKLYQAERTFDRAGNVIAVNTPTPMVSEVDRAKAEGIYNRLQAGCKAVAASLGMVTTIQQGNDLTKPLQALADQLLALVLQFQTGGAK